VLNLFWKDTPIVPSRAYFIESPLEGRKRGVFLRIKINHPEIAKIKLFCAILILVG